MAGNDTVAGNEGVPVTGNVLRNDSDPDGDPLRVTQFSVDVDGDGKPDSYNAGDTAKISGVGELTLNPDGSYTFTPDPGWSGKVPKVDYTISDGQGGTDSASLDRSEEHTSELQSLMRISYAVFCLNKKIHTTTHKHTQHQYT